MGTILITGANRGIGLEFVRQYAADDWRVIACCRDPLNSPDLQKLAKNHDGSVIVCRMDVDDEVSVKSAAAELMGERIDVLVNNAGILTGKPRGSVTGDVDNFNNFGAENWMKVLRTNLVGPMVVTRAFLPHLKAARAAKVAMISSGWAQIGEMSDGVFMPYKTSKAGLNMAMRCLSFDLAEHGIAVFSLRPGWVQTDMGGAEATYTAKESVSGMKLVISQTGISDTGQFFDFGGQRLSW